MTEARLQGSDEAERPDGFARHQPDGNETGAGESSVPRSDPRAPSAERAAPDLSPEAVAAAGKLSDAWETAERARGHLYAFHQLIGGADFALDEAVLLLEAAGRPDLALRVRTELIGRNVVEGRWTYQLLEEFDGGYRAAFQGLEEDVRRELTGGLRHVANARLKEQRRTYGAVGHATGPVPGTVEDPPELSETGSEF